MERNGNCFSVKSDRDLDTLLNTEERLVTLWYASWCPFCVRFLPIFERQAGGPGLSFAVVKDDQENMGERYSVDVYPTVLFFERGAVSKRLDGVPRAGLNEEQLTGFIQSRTVANR